MKKGEKEEIKEIIKEMKEKLEMYDEQVKKLKSQ